MLLIKIIQEKENDLRNIIKNMIYIFLYQKVFLAKTSTLEDEEPKNFKNAVLAPKWRKAMNDEYTTLIKNNTRI